MPRCNDCRRHPEMHLVMVHRNLGAGGHHTKKFLAHHGHPTLALLIGIASAAIGVTKIFCEWRIYQCPNCGAKTEGFYRKKR